jgi:hypothetical protein
LGLAGIVRVLAEAKAQIEPLYERWRAVGGDAVPAWWDGAEEDLNEQARGVMARAEVEVAEYAELIKPLPKVNFEPIDVFQEINQVDKSNSVTTSSARFVPEPASLPLVPHDPPKPLPGMDPLLPGGPVLAGGGPSVPTSPGLVDSGQAGVPLAPSGAGGSGAWLVTTSRGPVLVPGGVIGPPATASTRAPGPAVPPPMGGKPARGAVAASSGARAVPGLVTPAGAPPGSALASQDRTGQSRRARPPLPTVPPANGYRTADGHLVTISGLNARHTGAAGRPAADPNDPWAVDTGVPAVITPDPPRRHDPGPGVIGIDR